MVGCTTAAPATEFPMCETCRRNSSPRFQFSRRHLLVGAASTAGLLLAGAARAKETKPPPKPQNILSPDASLERLLKGNTRYVEGVSLRHDFKHEREALAGGQNPLRRHFELRRFANRAGIRLR